LYPQAQHRRKGDPRREAARDEPACARERRLNAVTKRIPRSCVLGHALGYDSGPAVAEAVRD